MGQITLEVLAEKIESLAKLTDEKTSGITSLVNEKFKANAKEHNGITVRMDTANHRTSKLEDWKEAHIKEIETEMADVLVAADDKYAAKSVEKNFYGLVFGFILTVMAVIAGAVIK